MDKNKRKRFWSWCVGTFATPGQFSGHSSGCASSRKTAIDKMVEYGKKQGVMENNGFANLTSPSCVRTSVLRSVRKKILDNT